MGNIVNKLLISMILFSVSRYSRMKSIEFTVIAINFVVKLKSNLREKQSNLKVSACL